jgi:hypothetical protein
MNDEAETGEIPPKSANNDVEDAVQTGDVAPMSADDDVE